MPRGDHTGPQGFGPMTGRAAGYCAGYPTAGFANSATGRGMGRRHGNGFGCGHGRGFAAYPATHPVAHSPQSYVDETLSSKDELRVLREQAEYIARSLDAVNERINRLETTQEKTETD